MVRLNLLFEAIARGLRVSTDGDLLVVRGPRRLEPLARELIAHKSTVMTLLRQQPELANLDPFTAEVIHAFHGELLSEEGCRFPNSAASFAPDLEVDPARRWQGGEG